MSGREHEIMVDRSDTGHRAFCACGFTGHRRVDVEHALFDATDHRVRHLCRRLRRQVRYHDLPAGEQMWPWLLAHRLELDGAAEGELIAIVALVEEHMAAWVPGRALVAA